MSQNKASKQPRKISAAQVQPLEQQMPEDWPESWRDIALSLFTTLVVIKSWSEMSQEDLAMEMAKGIGQDLGGTQPYIPAGLKPDMKARRKEALAMLSAGMTYRQVALKMGITESRVRKIEAEERSARRKSAKQAGN